MLHPVPLLTARMQKIPAFLFELVRRCAVLKRGTTPAAFDLPPPVLLPGSAAVPAAAAPIPKILWTYWNQPQTDALTAQCMASWRRHCPEHEIVLVHPDNILEYVTPQDLPSAFFTLHPTKQSDWLRLYLVAHHGGYWFDASTVLTESLDWMAQCVAQQHCEMVGFYLQGFTRDARYPVIESWAFGAPAHAAFMHAWQQEFHLALIVEGTEAYLARLQAQPDSAALLQGIADPSYLLIHVTAQQVLRRQAHGPLALFKAEDTAFHYHAALRWKWYLLYPQLCLAPAPATVPPLVKLRGGERRHLGEMLAQHGGARPGSLWHRACGGA